jgi:hypothetical protein
MAYDGSGRHPALEALEQRAGLAEVIAGHVAATLAFLWAPVMQHQSLGREGRGISTYVAFSALREPHLLPRMPHRSE